MILPFALPPVGSLPGEAIRGAALGALFLAIFAAAELWRMARHPDPEWTRKLVHVGGGLAVAPIPWLFGSAWTVLALGAAFAGILWGTRRVGWLRSVHGVARRSEGGIYFPVSVCALYLLAHGRPLFFLVSLLVLVVADTAAALVGSRYGRLVYPVEGDRRTLEGSAVFFATAFLCVGAPLLASGTTEPVAAVLIAAQLALVVTFLEGISLRGSDNLVVPLATLYLMVKMTPHDAAWIGSQLAAQLAITGAVFLLAIRLRFVRASGAMALSLTLYGAYSLGGGAWLVAPGLCLGAFLAFRAASARRAPLARVGFQVRAMFWAGIVAAVLFIANNALETLVPAAFRPGVRDVLYVPFVGAVAAQLAALCLALVEHRRGAPLARATRLTAAGAAAAGFALVVPAALAVGTGGVTAAGLAASAGICFGSLALYRGTRRVRGTSHTHWDGRLQALSVACATALVLPLHLHAIGVV
ncbi:MAG: hypothetical protein JWM27_1285 [Gemmatimonadetes bacterium]|nr:hypothetical protein [Gemmatimonadota bacterium]